MRQMVRNQQMEMQGPQLVQPYGYPMNQPAFPAYQQQLYGAQPTVQMGRPQCPRERPMQRPYSQERQQPSPQVRGRPHESCMMREVPVQPSRNQYVEDQIRFHENELMRLRNLMRREEPQMRREIPINTCESLETHQPLRRKPIPVGQPLYEKDANSSFASEYPEIWSIPRKYLTLSYKQSYFKVGNLLIKAHINRFANSEQKIGPLVVELGSFVNESTLVCYLPYSQNHVVSCGIENWAWDQ